MSNYTYKLGELVENGFNVFDFDYPMIAGYRKRFEYKFILHFYDYEINFKNPSQFKRRLMAKLNDIMPYYIKLYKTENLIDNPFETFKLVTSYTRGEDTKLLTNSLNNAITNDMQRCSKSGKNNFNLETDVNFKSDINTQDNYIENGQSVQDTNYTSNQTNTKHSFTNEIGNVTNEEKTKSNKTEELTQNKTTENETNGTSNEDYNETHNDTVRKLFSDTPQENFVISNNSGAPDYTPISSYATTLNQDTSNGGINSNKNIKENSSSNGTEKTTNNNTITDDTTTNGTTNSTKDTTYDDNSNFNQKDNKNETINSTTTSNEEIESNTISNEKTDTQTEEKTIEENLQNTKRDSLTTQVVDETIDKDVKGLKNQSGFNKNVSDLLLSFRQTFINIDLLIFDECNNLFMGVYC